MRTKRTLPIDYPRNLARLLFGLVVVFLMAGCGTGGRPQVFPENSASDGDSTATQRPTLTLTPTPTELPWQTFEMPTGSDPTPAPKQANRVALPEGTKVWLLLGAEDQKPSRGRTNAIHILLVNERLSKASILSIPGSLFVYLPGSGMGRLNTAYPLGGIKLVSDTLVYNFGLRPDRYVVAHETEFVWLVDDLDRLEVSVLFSIRDDCGGLPAGLHSMDGKKALCYVSYRGDDEISRVRRQQQVLQLLYTKLVQLGRMAKLPVMYASYHQHLDTDISLLDLLSRVPLALRLGDPARVKGFVLGWEQLDEWELPDQTRTKVLLPKPEKLALFVDQAVEAISEPSALNAVVLTYEVQLTQVIGSTRTSEARLTELARPTNTPTATVTQPVGSATISPTPAGATPVPTGTTPQPTSTPDRPYPTETVPTAAIIGTPPYPP